MVPAWSTTTAAHFQTGDGARVFALRAAGFHPDRPTDRDFTAITPGAPTPEEITICAQREANLRQPVGLDEVVWALPACARCMTKVSDRPEDVTRDYHPFSTSPWQAPLLTVYGGKITTFASFRGRRCPPTRSQHARPRTADARVPAAFHP